MKRILGIDIGGVIMTNNSSNKDTSFFSDNFLKTKANDDAFTVIKRLVSKFDEVYIVSKCGDKVQQKTLKWFDYHQFYELTGVKQENVFFCLERKDKAPICEKLGITHFIDDKLEVLSYLTTVPNKYLFKSRKKDLDTYQEFLPLVKRVESWDELGRVI